MRQKRVGNVLGDGGLDGPAAAGSKFHVKHRLDNGLGCGRLKVCFTLDLRKTEFLIRRLCLPQRETHTQAAGLARQGDGNDRV